MMTKGPFCRGKRDSYLQESESSTDFFPPVGQNTTECPTLTLSCSVYQVCCPPATLRYYFTIYYYLVFIYTILFIYLFILYYLVFTTIYYYIYFTIYYYYYYYLLLYYLGWWQLRLGATKYSLWSRLRGQALYMHSLILFS